MIPLIQPSREQLFINRLKKAKREGMPLIVFIRRDHTVDFLLPRIRYRDLLVFKDPVAGVPRILVARRWWRFGSVPVVFAVEPFLVPPSMDIIKLLTSLDSGAKKKFEEWAAAIIEKIALSLGEGEERDYLLDIAHRLRIHDESVYEEALEIMRKAGVEVSGEPDFTVLADLLPTRRDIDTAWLYSWERTAFRVLAQAGLKEATLGGWGELLRALIPVAILAVIGFLVWQLLPLLIHSFGKVIVP